LILQDRAAKAKYAAAQKDVAGFSAQVDIADL
jgi:hypothetical protein